MNRNSYNFLTTYTKDYIKRPIILVSPILPRQEFDDPITEGYKNHLLLEEKNVTPPNEDAETYLRKFKENYKSIANAYFRESINKKVIFRNKMTKGTVSEYQMKYCDIEKDLEFYLERKTKKAILPDEAQCPLTTYTSHYRNPLEMCDSSKDPSYITLPTRDLGSTELKLRKILNPKTGKSEYQDGVGLLGGILVRESAHGKINKPCLSLKVTKS